MWSKYSVENGRRSVPAASNAGRRQSVPGDDAFDDDVHRYEEQEQRQNGADKRQLPEAVTISVSGELGVLQPGSAQRAVPGQG